MAEVVKRARDDCTFPKMKRAKLDLTKIFVGTYLSARHYSESETQNRNVPFEQFLISQLVDKETARPNSILYSNSSFRNTFSNDPNPIQVEPYYSKFLTWINRLPEDIKTDISKFISPLFCHLYLDLLQGNHQQSANLLLKCYQDHLTATNIVESELCAQVVKEFACLEIKSRPIIKSFRSSKHKIKISSEAINILRNYLSKHGHVLILQVLQTWFDIEISSKLSEMADLDENESDSIHSTLNGDINIQEIDTEIQELQDTIASVKQQPPSVLQVNIFNTQDKATCGLISSEDEKAVVGFSTSEIYVWGLGNTLLPCPQVSGNASRIPLACDNIPEDVENPFENSPQTPTGAVILRGHGDSIQDVKFLQKNGLLLSVSQDNSMRAWNLTDYSCAAIYKGHNYPIWCLDVSSFGIYIATGSYDKSIRLWTIEQVNPIRILAGHTKDVNCVNFHPNGSYLASGSADSTVRMWSVSESKSVRLLLGHSGVVYSTAFSPDGKYLASAGDDKIVRIWDITAAKQLSELNGCANVVTGLCWSKDGRHLAAASLDNCVRVWNTDSAIKKCVNDINNLDISSVYNTRCNCLLSVKYDTNWLTCLTSTI